MQTILERKVEELKEQLTENPEEVKSLERLKYRLSDAIREGCSVSSQAFHWAEGTDQLCAMSAAVVAAKARGYR